MLSFDSVKINDKNPFLEYVKSLNDYEQADISVAINKLIDLRNNNQRVTEKLSKYISNGIFELRIRHTNRISRCLYFFAKDNKIVFTNGFIKKQQKTPANEIKTAIKFKTYYLKGI